MEKLHYYYSDDYNESFSKLAIESNHTQLLTFLPSENDQVFVCYKYLVVQVQVPYVYDGITDQHTTCISFPLSNHNSSIYRKFSTSNLAYSIDVAKYCSRYYTLFTDLYPLSLYVMWHIMWFEVQQYCCMYYALNTSHNSQHNDKYIPSCHAAL